MQNAHEQVEEQWTRNGTKCRETRKRDGSGKVGWRSAIVQWMNGTKFVFPRKLDGSVAEPIFSGEAEQKHCGTHSVCGIGTEVILRVGRSVAACPPWA